MARRRGASRFSAIADLPRAGGLCSHAAQIDFGKARATELGRRRSDPPTRQKWRRAGSADPARRPPPRPTRRLATPRSLAVSAVPYQPDDAGDPVAFDSRKPATVTPESSHPSYLSELMAMVHAL